MSGEGNNKNVPVIKQETLEKLLQNFKKINKKLEKEGIWVRELMIVKDKILSIVLFFYNQYLKRR